MRKILIPFFVVALLFCACDKESDEPNATDSETKKIDKIIYDILSVNYYWNEKIPAYVKGENRDPKKYFESLLYVNEDKWSYISDDSEKTNAEMQGTPYSMGYSPYFVLYGDENDVMMIVEYVYPGSPAEKAGLKRGDIVLTINGEWLTKNNYIDLYYKENATFGLGKINTSSVPYKLSESGKKIKIKAETIDTDPSIYDTIFNIGGKQVGYYVFTEFTMGNKFINSMDNVFDKFKSAGVKDLILDLRYNGGGSVQTAMHLASAIAPAGVANDKNIFFYYMYNDIVQAGIEKESDYVVNIPTNEHNADMSNLYVICTKNTASASELVACGLMPYMNVKLIGTNTHGKYCGMFVFDKSVEPKLDNWLLCPICFKYANANGMTDFRNGLPVDYFVEEDIINMYPFGDINDPMLATALDVATGQPLTAKGARVAPSDMKILDWGDARINNNLIVSGLLK